MYNCSENKFFRIENFLFQQKKKRKRKEKREKKHLKNVRTASVVIIIY